MTTRPRARRTRVLVAGGTVVALAVLVAIAVRSVGRDAAPCTQGQPCPSPTPPPGDDPVIAAAGDSADPSPTEATAATAQLVSSIAPAVALTLGDNEYPTGALADFQTGYGSTWGAFLSRTRPAIGNHEYESSSTAAGYFSYFGARAPDHWYSFDVGSWHLISLDSNCDRVGGCDPGSSEYDWLQADLAAHPARCTLAYWHHPRWSSGSTHGNSSQVGPFVELLYAAGGDVILSGHEHNYERFAPQTPAGDVDDARGIVEFVVGTGGHSLYGFGPPDDNSVARNSSDYGVLQMTLRPSGYDWSFRPVLGGDYRDSGSATCH